MNRYPLWKNLLVFGVIVLSTIIALPNFFGDDEAVQVSRTDGVAIDAPALEQVRTALMEARRRRTCRPRSRARRRSCASKTLAIQERARDVLDEGDAEPRRGAGAVAAHAGMAARRSGSSRCCSASICAAACTSSTRSTSTTAVGQYLDDLRDRPAHAVPRARNPQRRPHRRHDAQVAIIEPADMDRAEEIIRALDSGDQLMQLGQLTSRLIVDRAQVDGRPGLQRAASRSPRSASARTSRSSRTR